MEENSYGKPSPKIPPIALVKSVLVWAVLSANPERRRNGRSRENMRMKTVEEPTKRPQRWSETPNPIC
jgi:hypothetical protein